MNNEPEVKCKEGVKCDGAQEGQKNLLPKPVSGPRE